MRQRSGLTTRRAAFSMLDVLVILALAVIILTLLIWRVSKSRESARRIECESQIRDIFVAMESYHLLSGFYPIGTQNPASPIRSEPVGYHHNWIEALLPQFEMQDRYDSIDFRFGVYSAENAAISASPLDGWICPSADKSLAANATSYVGICSSIETAISPDNDGTLIQNQPLSQRDLTDGLAYVVIVGEKARELGDAFAWNSGTRASLRTLGHSINAPQPDVPLDPFYVGGLSSNHGGGAYLLTAAGEIRFYTDDVDLKLLQQLGGRSDSYALKTNPTE